MRNLSDQPIYDTSVYALLEGEEVRMVKSPRVVPPQGEGVADVIDDPDMVWTVNGREVSGDDLTLGDKFGSRFTDASGWRRWHRHPDGRLTWQNPRAPRRPWTAVRRRALS